MNQDQLFIWKRSLGGSTSWVGPVSGDLQGSSKSVSQVDSLRYGTKLLALRGEGLEKGQWPLHATDAFQASTWVLELRGSESE